MPDNFTGDFLLEIMGATNNDLSDPTQGICGVRLNFDHQYLGDLAITLTSPGGQQITLVGPIALFGPTDFSTYDISFVPCSVTPMPDGGPATATFNNVNLTAQNFDFDGSYHPNSGCLEDFNLGPINGTWTLTVTDGQAIDAGIFNDYEIIFCDDTGINCNTNVCGTFAEVEAPSFACVGDTITIDASGSGGNTFIWGASDGGEFIGTPSGPFAQVAVSGTYSVTVSDNGQCPEVGAVIFQTVPGVPEADINISGVLDCNNDQILLEGSTDMTDDIFVNWIAGAEVDPNNFNPLGMELDLEITEPGTYTLVVINTESACSQTATVTVEDESELPIIQATVSDTISCTNDTITITSESSLDGSTFEWGGPNGFTSDLTEPEVIAGGTYNLTVTAPNGCVDSVELIVEIDTIPPDFMVGSTNDIDCSITTSTLSITSSETIGTTSWSGPDGFTSESSNPEVSLGGTYTVIASGENGCTSESSIEVMQTADLPDISVVEDGVINCNNTAFELTGNSTTAGVNYEWTGPNSFNSELANPGMVTDTGTYILTVTAPNGCSVMSQVFINADTLTPAITLDAPTVLDCNNNTTTLTSQNADPAASYMWTGPNAQTFTEAEPIVEGPGTYNLIVTGENGCTNLFSVDVMIDDTEPQLSISPPTELLTCTQTELSLINTSDPNNDYNWSGPNDFISTEFEPLINEAGTYTVIVTGANGCTNTDMVMVQIDTLSPDINFTTAEITCTESVVSIGVNSSVNIVEYAWTGVGGYTSAQQNPDDITEGGSYTAIITAENGCTNSITFEVGASMDMPDGEIDASAGSTLSCNTTELALSSDGVTPGSTLSWLDPNDDPISSDVAIMADETGTYTLVITAPNGCERRVDIEIDEDVTGPVVTANPDVDLLCFGAVSLSVSSMDNIVDFAWSGPNGFNSLDSSPTVETEGLYSVILTGDNGCTSESMVEVINMQEMPSVIVAPTQTLICGSDQLTFSGGSNEPNVSLTWTTPNGSIVSGIDNQELVVNSQGTYILTVTNLDNGCTASDEVLVEQDNDTPIANIDAVESETLNCITSSITLNAGASDNGAGFSFVWGNNGGTPVDTETTLQTTITEPGTYFITVTNDINQCTSIASVTIGSDIESPALELSPIEELNCTLTTLEIENIGINITGNSLEYDWQTVSGGNIISPTNSSNIEVDMPGTYTVILTNNQNGCTSEVPFEVTQNIEMPVVNAGQNATLDCGVSALPLAGSITSGETNINISWTSADGNILSGEDTFTPEVSAAGTYVLTVMNNDNGCSNESQVTIDPNMDLPVIAFADAVDFTCGTASIVLDASTSTSGPGINYNWTSTSGANIFDGEGPNPEIFEPGEYVLTISNTNNNCESTNSIIVGADTLSPSVVVDQAENLSCTVNEIQLNISSDLNNLDIQWAALTGNILNGENTANPNVDQAGNYEVVVTSTDNQCTATAIVEVSLDDNTPTAVITNGVEELELTCNSSQITLNADMSSQGNNISILWENENGNFVSGEDGLNPIVDMPGMYTLTIIDDINGCEVSQSVVVTENMILPQVDINPPSTLNCLTTSTTVQAINMGGSDYEYEWQTSDGNIVSGATTLNPEIDEDGNYQLIATDLANGCTNTFDIEVLQDISVPTIVVDNTLNLTCAEPTAVPNGSGSSVGAEFIYSWTDASENELANTLETAFDVAGTYTLEIRNQNNGCSDSAILVVQDLKETPEVVVNLPETITCDIPVVSLSAQDANNENLEYTWRDENGNVVNSDNSVSEIEVDFSGSFSVLIVNPTNGCDTTISVFVDSNLTNPEVEVTANNDGIISCENPEVQLTGTINGLNPNEVNFVWQAVSGNILSGENTLTPIVNVQGTYQLMVIDLNNGCTNMSEVNITQDDAVPLATLNAPQELNCNVLETVLTIPSNTGNIDIVWTLNGNPIANANTNELVVSEPGEYAVFISNIDNGCNSMDLVTVNQDIDDPIIDAGAGFELQCNIPEFEIQATSDNPNYTFVWDAGSGNITQGQTTLNPIANAAGTYTLLVTNEANGCVSSDEVIITQNDNLPFDLLVDAQNPLCADDLGGINIIEVLGGEGPYTYSIDGGATFTDQNQFESLQAGEYEIAILDSNECPFAQELSIDAAPTIGVDVPAEIELLLGDSSTLNANLNNIDPADIQSIRWSPSNGLSCDDCLNPTVLANGADINYEVEVILSSGCSTTDAIQLRVDRNLNVYVPDAFSPYNLDGINDEFFLFARDRAVTNIVSFAIFDRWGNQVFLRENIQPNDPNEGWKGEYRDETYNPGVFIYVIEVEFRTGNTEILKGNVTVME